jgi:hypothetical protein
MKKFVFVFFSLFIVLAGCSQTDEESEPVSANKVPDMIEVIIQTPETIHPNEEVVIEVLVTQGDEKVDDANEVKFEIRKSGQDELEMLDGIHQGNGIYSVEKTFDADGTYIVIAHVTARDMHNMPKKEIIIGTPDQALAEDQSHDHGHSHVSIELQTNETFTVNKKATLSAKILNEGKSLEDAIVSFEVWQANQENRDFIDATEGSGGEYNATKTFSTPGTYEVKVHVKTEKIHEHQQESIKVKK